MANQEPRRQDLLTPTLAPDSAVAPLYSVGCAFVMALSGPVAVGTIMAINAKRLGRLGRDAWIFVTIAVATVILMFVIVNSPDLFTIEDQREGSRTVGRYALHGAGLLILALVYLRYRPYYRAMTVSGLDSPPPWKIGTLVFVLGGAAQFVVLILIFALRRSLGFDAA